MISTEADAARLKLPVVFDARKRWGTALEATEYAVVHLLANTSRRALVLQKPVHLASGYTTMGVCLIPRMTVAMFSGGCSPSVPAPCPSVPYATAFSPSTHGGSSRVVCFASGIQIVPPLAGRPI
jgi:hypothetical protein